jgi:hypothetical protein
MTCYYPGTSVPNGAHLEDAGKLYTGRFPELAESSIVAGPMDFVNKTEPAQTILSNIGDHFRFVGGGFRVGNENVLYVKNNKDLDQFIHA